MKIIDFKIRSTRFTTMCMHAYYVLFKMCIIYKNQCCVRTIRLCYYM